MKRGYSLVELVVVMAISTVMLSVLYAIFATTMRVDQENRPRTELRIEAVRVLEEITRQLKSAGPIDVNGDKVIRTTDDYPYLYTDGTATGVFTFLSHAPALRRSKVGDDDYGPIAEIAYKVPKDLDGDGFPTNRATGAVEWSRETFSFVVVPGSGPNSTNELQLRTFDSINMLQSTQTISRNVERMLVQQASPTEFKVTLWYRRPGPNGQAIKLKVETTATLRSVGQE